MYSEWFGGRLQLDYSRRLGAGAQPDPDVVSEFLNRRGYREIARTDDGVTAVRGSKAWNLINIGDPRRLYHSTHVTLGPDSVAVRTEVDTWFGLGTRHDAAVFEAEIDMLGQLLETGVADESLLSEAQARRQKSDLFTCLILLGIGVLLGVAAVAAMSLFVFMRSG